MGVEIERKFLIVSEAWRAEASSKIFYRQGYLNSQKERVVRVRVKENTGYLTIKGQNEGAKRLEFEYEIPFEEAMQMLDKLCERPFIEKYRYTVDYGGLLWEIDEFLGENEGLIVAEVELSSEDQAIEQPHWVGADISLDPKYFNAQLIKKPYKTWGLN